MDTALYLVIAMVVYDLSIHLLYLFGLETFFLRRGLNYWPEWTGRKYQAFWSCFWGTALIILLLAVST